MYHVRPDFGGPYIIDVKKQFSGRMVLKRDRVRERESEREIKRVKFNDNK